MIKKLCFNGLLLLSSISLNAQFAVTIDTTVKFQVFKGFGAAMSYLGQYTFTESSMKTEWDNMGRDNARIAVFSDSNFIKSKAELDAGTYDFTKSEMYKAALYLKEAKKWGMKRVVMEIFSPPGWMKSGGMNLCVPYPCTFDQNYLLPAHYADFAKWAGIEVKEIIKIVGDVDFFLSIQNEPRFEEPWTKCRYRPGMYADVLKVTGAYFQTNDTLKNVKLFGPTDMGDWATQRPWMDTLLNVVPEAGAYFTAWGNQGYMDGVNPNIGDSSGWTKFADTIIDKHKMELWMSSSDASLWKTYDEMLNFGRHAHMALKKGRVSCFHYWNIAMFFSGNVMNTKGQFVKQFFRFIPYESRQFSVEESEKDLIMMGFKKGNDVTITCLNDDPVNVKTFQMDQTPAPFFHVYSIDSKEQTCGYKGKMRGNTFSVNPKSILTLYYNESDTSAVYAPVPSAVKVNIVSDNSVSISWTPAQKWIMKGVNTTYDVNIKPGYKIVKKYDFLNSKTVTDTSYTFTGLKSCTEYTFSIVTTDSLENACFSTIKVKTTGTGCDIAVEEKREQAVTIYPNPATGIIFLDAPDVFSGCDYIITDRIGTVVMNGKIIGNSIDVSALQEGIYFVKLVSDERSVVRSFVKL